ncbi:unnamed protein product [Chrysodeixis includens]|uniref:Uncharacterized protein n=1 Tax=Chrysodeixis includens TaxID=689277 RepID=A0A9N8KRU2_CHRIL|nr:unnamed protein product [Chrysodeixis includens]
MEIRNKTDTETLKSEIAYTQEGYQTEKLAEGRPAGAAPAETTRVATRSPAITCMSTPITPVRSASTWSASSIPNYVINWTSLLSSLVRPWPPFDHGSIPSAVCTSG